MRYNVRSRSRRGIATPLAQCRQGMVEQQQTWSQQRDEVLVWLACGKKTPVFPAVTWWVHGFRRLPCVARVLNPPLSCQNQQDTTNKNGGGVFAWCSTTNSRLLVMVRHTAGGHERQFPEPYIHGHCDAKGIKKKMSNHAHHTSS